jgi:hypothetical protein
MADIARLLFGSGAGEADGPLTGEGAHADRLAQAREWCQTSPDQASIQWLAGALGARRRLRKTSAARGTGA